MRRLRQQKKERFVDACLVFQACMRRLSLACWVFNSQMLALTTAFVDFPCSMMDDDTHLATIFSGPMLTPGVVNDRVSAAQVLDISLQNARISQLYLLT